MFDFYSNLLSKYKEGELFDPPLVHLLVTNKCNLKCRHCFNWEANNNKSMKDLTFEEYQKITDTMGRIGVMMVCGGEPFLKDDLPEIVNLFVVKNKAQRFGFSTNGFNTEKTIRTMELMLQQNPETSMSLSFSIDGPKDIHNMIRGNDKVYSNAVYTWHKARELKEKYKNLVIEVSSVVNSYNQDYLDELYDLFENELHPDHISALLIRQNPSDNGLKNNLDINKYEQYVKKVESFVMSKTFPDRFSAMFKASQLLMYRLIIRTIKSNSPQIKCVAGQGSVLIDNEGGVFACECRRPVGYLRENNYDFKKIYYSQEFDKEREDIKKCFCTHETEGIGPSLPFASEYTNELNEIIEKLISPKGRNINGI